VKIGSGVFFRRSFGAFRVFPKALLLALERARVRPRARERSARGADSAFGGLSLFFGSTFGRCERLDAQATARAMELGTRQIVRARQARFEPRTLRLSFGSRAGLGRPPPGPRLVERRSLAPCSSFRVGEFVRPPVDPVAPHADERLEGIALLHPSFLSGDTRE
jgi:hypothetical protein